MVELIKISHHLAFRFKHMYLDWIPREENTIADAFAKHASKPRLVSELEHRGEGFGVFFSL